jgi:hypothetical protein
MERKEKEASGGGSQEEGSEAAILCACGDARVPCRPAYVVPDVVDHLIRESFSACLSCH